MATRTLKTQLEVLIEELAHARAWEAAQAAHGIYEFKRTKAAEKALTAFLKTVKIVKK